MRRTQTSCQSAEDWGKVYCGFEVIRFYKVVWFSSLLLRGLKVGTEQVKS